MTQAERDRLVALKKAKKKLITQKQAAEELGLTERSRNCLKRAGINTIAQLVNATERDLTSITNFGATSLKDVNDRLEERGLSLRVED